MLAARSFAGFQRDDLLVAIGNMRTSLAWAWLDTRCQYRRSKIGPLWETINAALLIGGLAIVTSAIFGERKYVSVGYIGLGIVIWSFIASVITEGCNTFINNKEFVLGSNITLDLYIGRTVSRALITFAHHLALYLVALVFGLVPLAWTALLAIPGIVLLTANMIWMVALLAMLCTRFRDITLIVRNLVQAAFLLTPVFWDYQLVTGPRRFIVDFNPFFHLIQVVRMPLLGEVPTLANYLAVVAMIAAGSLAVAYVYRRMRRNLAFYF